LLPGQVDDLTVGLRATSCVFEVTATPDARREGANAYMGS
jgi:hypothetical protein